MTLDIDEAKVERNELGLWLGWTAATAVGMLVGFLPFVLFLDLLDLVLARILIPLWAGFLIALFQWLVLRGFLTHTVDWILNGGAGWALGFALGLLVIQALSQSLLGIYIGYALFGVIIAAVQWPVLRREIPNLGLWVLVNILGWGLGAFASQLVLNAVAGDQPVSQALSTGINAGITGLVAGALTGLALVWIVRQPERGAVLEESDRVSR